MKISSASFLTTETQSSTLISRSTETTATETSFESFLDSSKVFKVTKIDEAKEDLLERLRLQEYQSRVTKEVDAKNSKLHSEELAIDTFVKELEHRNTLATDTNNKTSQEVNSIASKLAAAIPSEAPLMKLTTTDSISVEHSTSLNTKASITTEDNKNISLEFAFTSSTVSTATVESSVIINAMDPLVLTFDGKTPSFTDEHVKFDLVGDEKKEQFYNLSEESGFLALDKNKNNTIDNGKELFGPESGNGFKDLALYDTDHNNFIDENDAVYKDLSILKLSSNGTQTITKISKMNVGAIALNSTSISNAIKGYDGTAKANITDSGVFLKEKGGFGYVHNIDLVTS